MTKILEPARLNNLSRKTHSNHFLFRIWDFKPHQGSLGCKAVKKTPASPREVAGRECTKLPPMLEHDSLAQNSIVQSNPLSNRRHFQSNVGGQYKRNGKTFSSVVNRRTWGRKREPSLSVLKEKKVQEEVRRHDGGTDSEGACR